MKITQLTHRSTPIAEIHSEGICIHTTREALDLMADCGYQGAAGLLIREEHLMPEFFDLKTGIAGEILQKFSTYRMKLAIVGDFGKYESKSLRDFIRESNKGRQICFASSREEALEALAR